MFGSRTRFDQLEGFMGNPRISLPHVVIEGGMIYFPSVEVAEQYFRESRSENEFIIDTDEIMIGLVPAFRCLVNVWN